MEAVQGAEHLALRIPGHEYRTEKNIYQVMLKKKKKKDLSKLSSS